MVINQKVRAAVGLCQKLDKTRQTDLITAMGAEAATERQILNRVGDTRYTRELLRKLISMNIVERTGKGGLHDPFLYKLSPFLGAFDFSCVQDPVLERRMKRIEGKILELLSDHDRMVARSERCIRAVVGDNTGTGKALRRLVKSSKVVRHAATNFHPQRPRTCSTRTQHLNLTPARRQVVRIGKGGAGNPFTYRLGDALLPPLSPAPCPAASADSDDGPPPSPAQQPPALCPAAIFEEMAALMAPRSPGPRFRGAALRGSSFGGGGADDSVDDEGGAGGEEDAGDGLGLAASLTSSSLRGRAAAPSSDVQAFSCPRVGEPDPR